MRPKDPMYRAWLYSTGPTVSTKTQAKKHRKKYKVVGLPRKRRLGHWKPPEKMTLGELVKHLQESPSKAEKLVYDLLRARARSNKKLYFLFNCVQGPYIPDFFFPKSALIVECDGPQHTSKQMQSHDSDRDHYFFDRGIKTLRYDNGFIFRNPNKVVLEISGMAESRYRQCQARSINALDSRGPEPKGAPVPFKGGAGTNQHMHAQS